jgi:type II secretory pathway component GspD/PulD (secretin)
MLLKTRREFTLCFFLFAPLGMAGYTAETLEEGSGGVEGNITSKAVRNLASQSESNTHAEAALKGGQAEPSSVGGGQASSERVSRLLVDGRKAYRDGDLKNARTRFQEALSLDGANPEARRYLGEIDRHADGAQFSADAPIDGVPVKRNTPAPSPSVAAAKPAAHDAEAIVKSVKEDLKPSTGKISLNASESLGTADASRFSKAVSKAVSFAAPVTTALKNAPADPLKDVDPAKTPVQQMASVAAPSAKPSLDGSPKGDAAPKSPESKADTDKKSARTDAAKPAESKTEGSSVVALPKAPASQKAPIVPVLVAKKDESAKTDSAKPAAAEKRSDDKKSAKKDVASAPAMPVDAKAKASDIKEQPGAGAAAADDFIAELDELKAEALRVASAPAPSAAGLATGPEKKADQPAAEKKDATVAEKKADKKADSKKGEEKPATAKAETAKPASSMEAKLVSAPALSPAKLASANPQKSEPAKPSSETIAAIKLYNAGKYSEAAANLKAALINNPADAEAKLYLERSEKKLASAISDAKPVESKPEAKVVADAKVSDNNANASANPPLLDLSKITAGPKAEEKQVAQAPVELKPLGEALSKGSSTKDKGADSSKKDSKAKSDDTKASAKTEAAKPSESPKPTDSKPAAAATTQASTGSSTSGGSTDPIVEADKLQRQAQRELQEGKREDALATARKANALDPNNIEAKAMISDLSAPAVAGSAAKSLPSLQAVSSPAPVTAPVTTSAAPAAAPAAAAIPPAVAVGSAPAGVDALLTEGRNKYTAGNLREALTSFKAVLEKDPGNSEAQDYVQRIEAERGTSTAADSAAPSTPDKDAPKSHGTRINAQQKAQDAETAFQQGLVAYQAGRLDVAVQHWNYALTMDANHPRAIQYLEQTRAEYDAWVQQHQYNALELQKEVSATEKLDTAVTYDTAGQKTIVEFLSAMSLITDISFYVTDGVDPEIRVTAKFDDQPLHDALDVVLLPIGLKWSRTGDVVTVTPDLRTKFFNLTPEQVGRLKTLLENKTLQRYLYGPEGVPPMRNVELTLDDRENLLSVTDSQENINKIEAFVKDLQANGPTQLVYRNWKIRPEEGAKIKALVEAIVKVQSDAPYDLERKVVVDGDDLIVKDTAENVAKIEQLLLDKNFLRKLETQKLSVASYNLTPREPLKDNVEQVRDLSQSIVTVVKTILYAQSTESAAAAEGRRYWFDPNTLQLTVTDFPENLRVIGDYIRSLPMLGSEKQKSEIIFLKHQTSGDMVDLLNRVLGLSADAGSAAGTATGNSITKTLRVEGELTFRDLKLRVTKVNDNDINNDNDDSVEMVVRTATSSEDRTITEFHSDFLDEYEINVIEVRPSTTAGEGSARIEVRYNPQGTTGVGGVGTVGTVGAVTPVGGVAGPGGVAVPGGATVGPNGQVLAAGAEVVPSTESTMQVESIDNMNALLVRYEDPGDLAQVKSWLEQLDIPVLQVSIETKLVEVNESRVKQFMPKFNVLNLGQGGIDLGNNFNRFSGLQEQSPLNGTFEDPGLPLAHNSQNTDLLNPVSVFSIITGDGRLNFTLRMLESEGVLNMVNGPHITVENGESATFEIELTTPNLSAPRINTNNGTTGGTGTQNAGSMQQVDLEVAPQITQVGEIRLDIQNLELNDRGHHVAQQFTRLDLDGDGSAETGEPIFIERELGDGGPLFDNRRRAIQTVARVQNHGTIVLGGWAGEHSLTRDAGVPILRNLPYIGKLLFGQTADEIEKTNLLIFLTCHLVEP